MWPRSNTTGVQEKEEKTTRMPIHREETTGGHREKVGVCKKRGLRRNQTCWHLDLGLPASRTMKFLQFKPPRLWFQLQQPYQTNTMCLQLSKRFNSQPYLPCPLLRAQGQAQGKSSVKNEHILKKGARRNHACLQKLIVISSTQLQSMPGMATYHINS